ncbi:MAG: hypothetical protein VXW32_04370 [Myxococcota bacterium]|nr:hypothetical protein [Myxococcota bacterium]
MSRRLPLSESRIAIFGGLMLLAMVIRVVCSFLIGAGTFGPDGTGAEAAVHLGGHPNPLHPMLIAFFGGGRGLSVFSGAVTAVACAKLGQRLGGNPWTCGLMGACAPLLVLPSSMAGGDAPAIAFAASGAALAWWQRPLTGGLVAGLSLGVKAIAAPLLLLLPLSLLWSEQKLRHSLRLLVGALGPLLLFSSALDPLLSPRANSGILGSWWLASGGTPPGLTELPSLGAEALLAITKMPLWTGHPLLGLLAIWACIQARDLKTWAVLLVSGFALFATALLLGEQMRYRYLGPGSVGITVLAGLGLSRLRLLPWLFLWPSISFATQLGQLRSAEEGLNPRPVLPFLGSIDVEPTFEEGAICGGNELRDFAVVLADRLPPGAEVAALRLRDGRENELFWRLRILRDDLHLTHLDARCCGDRPAEDCAPRIRTHLNRYGGALVLPLTPETTGRSSGSDSTVEAVSTCKTHVASPEDLSFAAGFRPVDSRDQRFSLQTWVLSAPEQRPTDACQAARSTASGSLGLPLPTAQ